MKMAEAKLKGHLGLLSSFRAELIDGKWFLGFCDKSSGLLYFQLEGFRGGFREFKTLENLLKVSKQIYPQLDSFKVVL